ncbi:thymidine phosphorylase [Mycolicibacterium aichiense]|uniref:Thymidine phosphorylase n=1 Tax=Mycolicibacterium aichiense TaxID=1799 RepID=A0AAD1HJV3_9MYCO|nr:thymidine phosphorylase [Mycolicibacterium aichiense]MCV7017952.1 thymidine phosphorylase [Mycolicibacterium aichiense]BBX06431.1 thymidine phosphorylase [Mycolicibacterium aichiense]STZ24233.1 thymidine phosphorylase [Mycolicibacterium aichiense]
MTQFTFDAPTVIRVKRDGGRLSDEAVDWVIDSYTHGRVADEQMSALLMAIFLRGMDRGEISRWTSAMIASGERLDFSDLGRPTVDKHSTGGVGDKITIPLVPVVAACGAAVPQAAGRGLGHTGGTLDKLESIPGFTAEISKAQVRQQLSEIGAAIFAAGELAPADRKIYALRDVTGTVESLPLIASSVMSKKLAEGADALVLDVKVGRGAFLKTEAESRELAATMVELGLAHGVPTVAVLTDMDIPLGRTVGNALEVAESLEVLAGGGPDDVVELTVRLAREMLALAGIDGRDPAQTLHDGTAMDHFRALVTAQGGDVHAQLPIGAHSETVPAPRGGTMGDIDALAMGLAVWRLGAGRAAPGQPVQFGAGIRIHRRPGEPVSAGEPLFTLYTDTPERIPAAMGELDGAFSVVDVPPKSLPGSLRSCPPNPRPLIIDRISR